MFPSLAARETYVAETNFAARKPKMFLPEVKNIFVSRTKLLRSQHMFPSLATMKTMLISFQCRSLIKKMFPSNDGRSSAALRFSCQPISIWALLSDSFTFVVQTISYTKQLLFAVERHVTFTCIACSPWDEKM